MSDLLTVLYVEDNEGEVELLLLSIERYSVGVNWMLDVAESVEEAKVMFDLDKHMAAIIDWNLPDGKGTDVAQFIREKHPTLPILFLSAAMTNEQEREAAKYNPKACLEKDYSKGGLEQMGVLFR